MISGCNRDAPVDQMDEKPVQIWIPGATVTKRSSLGHCPTEGFQQITTQQSAAGSDEPPVRCEHGAGAGIAATNARYRVGNRPRSVYGEGDVHRNGDRWSRPVQGEEQRRNLGWQRPRSTATGVPVRF